MLLLLHFYERSSLTLFTVWYGSLGVRKDSPRQPQQCKLLVCE
jgi:hypothetical protein